MLPPSNASSHSPDAPGSGATVDQWLSYLEAIHPTEIDLGLDRVLVVLRRLFPRKPGARIITVAGTNGKGSAVATIEALLQAAGRTTGAYTSPHLQLYNERVRVKGVDISDADLVRAFEQVESARRQVSLTYFEFGTLAAFVAFAESGVQDWILEVGLGGRLDAVNVLDPDFAIITSVDIDHVAFLGDNREIIGFEKAGILRPGIPAVYGALETPRSVLQQVNAQKVSLALAGRDYQVTVREVARSVDGNELTSAVLDYGSDHIVLPSGPLPVMSVAAATVAIRQLEPSLSIADIEAVLSDVRVPGRFEQLASSPGVYVDVGHNPHAASWLASRIQAIAGPEQKVHAVYAALADKDVEGVLEVMDPAVDRWYFAGLDVPRGLSCDALKSRAGCLVDSTIERAETVAEALSVALEKAAADDLVIVFGSFFTVAEARTSLLGL